MIHYWDTTPAAPVEEPVTTEVSYLYILTDPDENCPYSYVGRSVCPYARLQVHMDECAYRQDYAKNRWLMDLKLRKLKPVLTILGIFPESEIRMVENDAIRMDKAIRGSFNTNIQVYDW